MGRHSRNFLGKREVGKYLRCILYIHIYVEPSVDTLTLKIISEKVAEIQ